MSHSDQLAWVLWLALMTGRRCMRPEPLRQVAADQVLKLVDILPKPSRERRPKLGRQVLWRRCRHLLQKQSSRPRPHPSSQPLGQRALQTRGQEEWAGGKLIQEAEARYLRDGRDIVLLSGIHRHIWVDPEKLEDGVQGARGILTQVIVEEDMDL